MTTHQHQRRIVVRFAGEALMGQRSSGVDANSTGLVAAEIASVASVAQTAVIVGGGNVVRGFAEISADLARTTADYFGMLASVLNAVTLQHAMLRQGVSARVLSALPIPQMVTSYTADGAREIMSDGSVVVLAGAIGTPLFTLDTAAAIRAVELNADMLIVVTPKVLVPRHFTFDEAIGQGGVLDNAALSICRENRMQVDTVSFVPGNLARVVGGELIGSRISSARPKGRPQKPKKRPVRNDARKTRQ